MNGHLSQPDHATPEDALNHRVLARHLPSLSTVLSKTPYSVIYTFSPQSSTWEKSGVEGTLFIVRLHPLPGLASPRYALVILNRRGLDNWTLELNTAEGVQVTEEYIILQGQGSVADALDGGNADADKIWGIWVFEEREGSTRGQRQETADWILRCAQMAEDESATMANGDRGEARDVDVKDWVEGIGAAEGDGQPGEVQGQNLGTSHKDDGNSVPQQQPTNAPDLMALLNQGRRPQQERGPPLAPQDPNAGRDVLGDLFKRAGENLRQQ